MAADALNVFQTLNDYFFRYYATPFAVTSGGRPRRDNRWPQHGRHCGHRVWQDRGVPVAVIASLLAESEGWSGSGSPDGAHWWEGSGGWQPQRAGEHGRIAATRAMVLYPMNALVEDQLVRLRRALNSPGAREWLDRHRRGHRFYFGRFTGQTPVSGEVGSSAPLRNLRDYLRAVAARRVPGGAARRRQSPRQQALLRAEPRRRGDALALGHAGPIRRTC